VINAVFQSVELTGQMRTTKVTEVRRLFQGKDSRCVGAPEPQGVLSPITDSRAPQYSYATEGLRRRPESFHVNHVPGKSYAQRSLRAADIFSSMH
jgi:hypothetical protein